MGIDLRCVSRICKRRAIFYEIIIILRLLKIKIGKKKGQGKDNGKQTPGVMDNRIDESVGISHCLHFLDVIRFYKCKT